MVVLAGDTRPGTKGLEWAGEAFPKQQVLYVCGNHEFIVTAAESASASCVAPVLNVLLMEAVRTSGSLSFVATVGFRGVPFVDKTITSGTMSGEYNGNFEGWDGRWGVRTEI